MERKGCCSGGRSYSCSPTYSSSKTPKKEPVVTPEKEDVKPEITKGEAGQAALKSPKAEEKVTVKEEEPLNVNVGAYK